MTNPGKRLLKLSLAFAIGAASATGALAQSGMNPELEHLLRTDDLTIAGNRILAEETLLEMYEGNGFRPFWQNRQDIRELLELIESAAEHGLNPSDYFVDEVRSILEARNKSPSGLSGAEADVILTGSLLRYGYHRRLGKVNARNLDPDINFRRDAFKDQPPHITLVQIMEAPSMQGFIDRAAPSGPVYQRLQHWLSEYRQIAAAGGWPAVAEGSTLRQGDEDPRVRSIRARLAVSGELPGTADLQSETFDKQLKSAVRLFQQRHRLDDDGIVGKQTVAAMNVTAGDRVDQLRISLERLRWVNQEAARTLVAVNIASFRVFFFEDGELEWTTRAMVGKSYRQTPVFRGDIAYMEFNPTWTIPPGILRNDTLPAIKRDPNYLGSKNIRVIDRDGNFVDPATVDWNRYTRGVPYTLRQEPGPNNALGTVKFIFPNPHFVFLHDTPSRELFDRPERAFSSGCIRVENPLKLAELLMGDPEQYSQEGFERIVASRKTQRINLTEKIPVVILYLTADLAEDGHVIFLKDIYDRDQSVLDALNGPVYIDLPETANS